MAGVAVLLFALARFLAWREASIGLRFSAPATAD
jgi:hypothetical protein